MKSKIFGPIDTRLNVLDKWERTLLVTEVFALVPSGWHGEYVQSEHLLAYVHPDLLSEESMAIIRDLKAVKIATPLLGVDYRNYLSDAMIDGKPFHECIDVVKKLYDTLSYVEILSAKHLCSKEQYFAHVFKGIDDRDVFVKFVARKRVKINWKNFVENLENGKIPRANGFAHVHCDEESLKSYKEVINICDEIYI